MSYRIEIRPSAQREIANLPSNDRRRIVAKVDALATNPRPVGSVKLSGQLGLWRIRVGVYRVLYEIHDKQLIVLVISVAHRRDVYRGL
jgi:mRNA interferase RelE/StbE